MLDHYKSEYRKLVADRHTYRRRAREVAELVRGGPAAAPKASQTSRAFAIDSRRMLSGSTRAALVGLLRSIRDLSLAEGADRLRPHIAANDPRVAGAVAEWRRRLRDDIAARHTALVTDASFDAVLETRVAQLFEAVVAAFDLSALEHGIDVLAPEKGFDRLGMEQRRQRVTTMTDRLAPLHGLPRPTVQRMIELRHDTQTEKVTLRAILDLYRSTWRNFGVGKDRRALVKLTIVILVNRLMHNAAPLLWTKVFDGKSFNGEYLLVLGGIDIIDAHSSKYESEISTSLLFEIRQRIHALAAQALFVRDLGLADKYGTGELFDIIWKGEDAYDNIVRSLLFDGVPTLLTIPIVIGGLMVLHPVLGALGMISLPFVYWLARTTGPRMQLAREETIEKKRALYTRGNTMIDGLETLLGQGHIAGGRKSFLDLVREGDRIDRDMIKKWAGIHLLQRYPVIVTGLVTALFGIWLVRNGMITPGGVITTTEYATRLRETVVGMIHRYFEQFPRDLNNARGLQRLLDWSARVQGDATGKLAASALPSTRIECKGLVYKDIVRNLSIAAEPGEFVTISGTSGIGKTTLLRLIAGLYKPSAGVVTIGGVPLAEIRSEGADSLYTLFAVSSQSPFIFDDMTLRQNLELFHPEPTPDDRIRKLLETVGLAKLVPDLDSPHKRRLSGGERVRFGLARVLLKVRQDRPMIVLLDEPTSSLADDDGPGSMAAIRDVLKRTHEENPLLTFICVTHDRKLVAQADRDITLSEKEVAFIPEPVLAPPAGKKELLAMPGIIVDFGNA